MITQSHYTKEFKSNALTHLKYNELRTFAVALRDHRNDVSKYVNSNLMYFLDMAKLTFIKEMRARFKDIVPSSFDTQLYSLVYTAYVNKFEAVAKRLRFEKITYEGCEFYKRDTKKNRKGDFKQVVVTKEATGLSRTLTWLARYGGEGSVEYMKSVLSTCDGKKRAFYEMMLGVCERFTLTRLLRLAMQRRERVIRKYSENPIEFKSLTFGGRSRKGDIIAYNSRFGSVINAFVSLSGLRRKPFDIPVKFSKGWHGNMRDYRKKNPDYEYLVTFDERHREVSVLIAKPGMRYIPEAGDNIMGIDVNVKHNLLSLSNGMTVNYDRKLVADYCRFVLETDRLKERDKDYHIGRRRQIKMDALKRKMVKSEQESIAVLCKSLQSQGVNHIVMEDLDNGFGKCHVKDKENEDINFNRKVKFLGLSSLKQEVEHIARKYDIAVSTVQASYTSKMCPICGCIEDANRPNQETFECIECGHKDNADFNAAKNIRNRVLVTVLRESLLKQLDNGAFEPRKLKREKVKEVLLSFRRSLSKTGCESPSLSVG